MIRWIHGLEEERLPEHSSVVSVGSFDGVHRGHEHVIRKMVLRAEASGHTVVIASFEPHPKTVLAGIQEQRLTSLEERAELLPGLGVDGFVALQFDHEMAEMSPEDFVRDVLVEELAAKVIVVGHDHRFGKGRAGDVALLRTMGGEWGFQVEEVSAFEYGMAPVSSSRIRGLIKDGVVSEAAELMGRPYVLEGRVIHGAGRGREIGVPTANLDPLDPQKIVPAIGVYAVKAHVPGVSRWLPGMMNIGHRPTFEGVGQHLEVNILDWSGDLYGREVRVEFVQRIRDEVKFNGVEALLRQLNADRERCRALLQGLP